MQGSSVCM